VPGIVKLIICAAKMKAPRTPIRGISFSSIVSLSFFEQYAIVPNEPAQKVAPTAGESNASAICITKLLEKKIKKPQRLLKGYCTS
jgi:hypothetical protein